MDITVLDLQHSMGTKSNSIKITVLNVPSHGCHGRIFNNGFQCANNCTRT